MTIEQVMINGVQYYPRTGEGEVVTVQVVNVIYTKENNQLLLGFDIPKTMFNVGDKVRLVIEEKNR